MSTTRKANAQEKAHCLYLTLGGIYLRHRRSQTSLYQDAAFRLPNVVAPDYMISRCKGYAECAEGGIWRIGGRCDTSRSEVDIFAAMDREYRSICAEGPGERLGGVSALSVNVGGEKRGENGRRHGCMPKRADRPSPGLLLAK